MVEDNPPAADREYRIRAQAVDWLDVEEQVVALDAQKSVYLSTNSSGALLWHSLVDGATIDNLVAELQATYGIDADRAATDVAEFIGMLSTHGLLEDL